MNIFKLTLFFAAIILLNSCASGYNMIAPKSINYISSNENDGVKLEYKYDLLDGKYEKKEVKNGVKLVSIKITNNTDRDLTFGNDLVLTHENNTAIHVMESEKVFTSLKQSSASYLFYLLLTPLNFYTTKTNSYGFQETTSTTPVGLVLGPGLAAGNMIAAGSANKKLKNQLMTYNIYGTVIPKGETVHGLIGIRTDSFDALKLRVN